MEITSDQSRQFMQLGFQLVDLNAQFVLIDKASGIGFHDELEIGNGQELRQYGIFSRVQSALLENKLINNKLYPVHRLDKGTSGLLLFARTKEVAQELGAAFEEGRVQKYYLALSKHKPKKKQGAVKGGMEKARRGAWKLGKAKDNYAISQFFSAGLGGGYRLFLWRPKTGKTHQLRVAMKSLGSPILGDKLYGCDEKLGEQGEFCLHAFQIGFELGGRKFLYTLGEGQVTSLYSGLSQSDLPFEKLGESVRKYLNPHFFSWPSVS
ncbi:pseudouridine synthase [uncultured Pseudoteredinibacter sp.]|uniref:pseudouridine synthase n=1 Tax=uncultured Pseudoteredinibacter sp. TaxID=1641701 RepID=UPI00260AB67A|nr:pseudouridine synthase [uncultured Pseudoteredinibacter sp.]